MVIRYQHTQLGTLLLVTLVSGAIFFAAMAYTLPSPGRLGLLAGAALLVVVAWLFSSLTVSVSESELQWRFGPGLFRYHMALTDIARVSVVRNSPFSGYGIRMRPGFRLYNVSGLDAVELRLKNGDIRRIGTDDAQGLAAALRRG
ncbi:MAG TPA: hypothetical protein VMF32_10845 [Xanthobacteraceae bacterium]|nr:hypothetical protein [Xanthobacteraceae bacterium]